MDPRHLWIQPPSERKRQATLDRRRIYQATFLVEIRLGNMTAGVRQICSSCRLPNNVEVVTNHNSLSYGNNTNHKRAGKMQKTLSNFLSRSHQISTNTLGVLKGSWNDPLFETRADSLRFNLERVKLFRIHCIK